MSSPLVLVVDDEPDIRMLVEMTLRLDGDWRVALASSAAEAVALAAELRPSVVLLDVMMPVTDGIAAFGMLRAVPHLADTPIVFLTAKVQRTELDRYRELGAVDVVLKPFDPLALPDRLRALLTADA